MVKANGIQRLIEEYGIKYIINYLRKSRQDEDRERKTGEDTLHEQKQLMDRVLASYGVPYDQKPEVGSGDKIATRPVFQGIIKDIQKGKYDAIAVKEISRMGRGSYTDMGTIYDLIREKRIYIITPYKIYDPTNPSDLRQIRFELFMSREEFETIRERLTGGRYNAAMEGKWVAGSAPYGYKYNDKTKRLEVKDEEAEMVRAIFDFYGRGVIINGKRKLVQFRALANYLKRVGIKTPRGKDEWHPVRLREFLSNDRYIGKIKFRTTQTTAEGKHIPRPESEHIIVEDAHEAIIDPETWQLVQNRLEGRDTTLTNTKLEFDPCELAGLCVCKVCGRKLIRQYSTQHYVKQDGSESVYHKEFLWCHTQGCTFVKYRNIEGDILETLKILQNLNDDILKAQLEEIVSQKTPEENNLEDLKRQLEIRKDDLKRKLKLIFEHFENGIYTKEEFVERKAALNKELAEVENFKIEDTAADQNEEIDLDIVRNNITSILDAYRNASSKSDKNKILRAVFDHVVVEVTEKGRGRKESKHTIYPVLKSNFVAKR